MSFLKSALVSKVFLSLVLASSALSQPKKLNLATEGAFPPFNFFEGKKLTGFDVEIGNLIAQKLGVEVNWSTLGFDSLLIALQKGGGSGALDAVVASHAITAEREKAFTFTAPYYCTGGVLVSKDSGPKTEAELKDKTIVAQVGSTYAKKAQGIPGVKKVITLPKDTDAYLAITSGKADAWITDRFVALESLKKNPNSALKIRNPMLYVEKIGIAVKKDNPIVAELNKGLKKALDDGSYAALSKKYFGVDIRCAQ